MIEPIKNVLRRSGAELHVLPGGNFDNVFPAQTSPILLRGHRDYLAFLNDGDPATVFRVHRWDSTPYDQPVKLRCLSIKGARRVRRHFDSLLAAGVEKINGIIREPVQRFEQHLQQCAMCEAEADIKETAQCLSHTIGLGFPYPYVKLPDALHGRLTTNPQKMSEQLTPERYRQGVLYYLDQASADAKSGFLNCVERNCNCAEYCARKGFDPDRLQAVLDDIKRQRDLHLADVASINRDREIAARFSWRKPNTRESFIAAELGYDPFPVPTAKDYAEIYAAEERLRLRGLSF